MLYFRRKRIGTNSIETVFKAINPLLRQPHENIFLPCEGGTPTVIIRNILFAHRHRSKINHITGDVHYIALGTGRNSILTIHDVGSALKGNWMKRFFVKILWFYLPALIVKRITVISEFTKRELLKIVPFAENKITVIYNPFSNNLHFSPKAYINSKPIILHIGTKENKNLERVLQAINNQNYKIIILGKTTEKQLDLLHELLIDYENYYDIEYEKVVSLYYQCDIVSFPSMYEGFGMPILEANAVGRPIIVGDIDVLHEVACDAAYYVNPYDVNAIAEGFKRISIDMPLRQKLVLNGQKNIQRFVPSTIASLYNDVYKSID